MAERRFLVFGHTQSTDADLSLNDLAGMGGRLDVLCRVVTSALCTSHGVRDDTVVWCAIDHDGLDNGPRVVRFDGASVRSLNPDERTTAALFKRAFGTDVVANGHFEAAHPGVDVARLGARDAMRRFVADGGAVLLDRGGVDLREAESGLILSGENPGIGFVLSDHERFSDAEHAWLSDLATGVVSVGATWLQGHGVVTLVHDELDRRGAHGGPVSA